MSLSGSVRFVAVVLIVLIGLPDVQAQNENPNDPLKENVI
jgi:hypothetical protein